MLFSESIKKIMLAGIGAVAVTAEKSKEIVDELVSKGELTVEQGKVLNEELKHKAANAIKDNIQVQVVKSEPAVPDAKHVLSQMEQYTPEELAAFQQKLNELNQKKTSETDTASNIEIQ